LEKHLTQYHKTKYFPLLIKRDGGFICWYCKGGLQTNKHVFEHLNDNREDNRIENIVLACNSCNNKKPHDCAMKNIAIQKLRENEEGNFMRERKFESDHSTQEASKEIEINMSNYEITRQFITKILETDRSFSYNDALDACVYTCKEITGHGSQQSVRNYIGTLTSIVSPFEIIRDKNKKKIIVRRSI